MVRLIGVEIGTSVFESNLVYSLTLACRLKSHRQSDKCDVVASSRLQSNRQYQAPPLSIAADGIKHNRGQAQQPATKAASDIKHRKQQPLQVNSGYSKQQPQETVGTAKTLSSPVRS